MCQGSIQYYIDLHCPIMSHLVKGSHVQPDLSIRTGPLGKVSKCRLLELHLFCSFVVTRLPCGKCNRKKDVGKKEYLITLSRNLFEVPEVLLKNVACIEN